MIHCFGILDRKIEGGVKSNPHYGVWARMIERCYSEASLLRNPQYSGVSVCEEWRYFSNFERWSTDRFVDGWTFDKDMINLTGNIYSSEACCYLPQELNKSILDASATRSSFGLGVWYKKPSCKMISERNKPFVAEINNKKLGSFKTPEEAHRCWQKAKVENLLSLAVNWFGKVDHQAIEGLVERAYLIEVDMKNRNKTHTVSKMRRVA